MHQMPEHVCRWNLAPGQDQRSRVTPGYDRGPRTQRDESRLCRGPVTAPRPTPFSDRGHRHSQTRAPLASAVLRILGPVAPGDHLGAMRADVPRCTSQGAGRPSGSQTVAFATSSTTGAAAVALRRQQHLSRELNATGDGGGSTSTVTPCRASPSILESTDGPSTGMRSDTAVQPTIWVTPTMREP
jgi:hypothetical protein